MTPKFSQAVDPVITKVLDLLDRIEHGEQVHAEQESIELRERIDRSEAEVASSEWSLARYALVCWADEMLVAARWPGANWWNEHVLEFAYYKSHDRATKFYQEAEKARGSSVRDALEVYYLCVFLGFRGFYRDQAVAGLLAEQLSLPKRLEDWVDQTAMAIIPIRQTQLPQGQQGPGAPALEGMSLMLSSFLVAGILGIATVLLKYMTSL